MLINEAHPLYRALCPLDEEKYPRPRIAVLGTAALRDWRIVWDVLNQFRVGTLITCHRRGTDALAELWAAESMIPRLLYRPKRYGRPSEHLCYERAVRDADTIIMFRYESSGEMREASYLAWASAKPFVTVNLYLEQFTRELKYNTERFHVPHL